MKIRYEKGKFLLLIAVFVTCKALSQANIGSLNIGDTIPSGLELTNVYNYPSSKIRLAEMKGKLVILDFWSTWCGACIETFPKMQSLQQLYKDNLSIVLVNTYEHDDFGKVNSFLKRRESLTGLTLNLPFSLLQTTFSNYFPHKFLPHYVWIDKKGEIIATTSQLEVTEDNIQAAIDGRKINIHKKKDILDFDKASPILANHQVAKEISIFQHSLLSNYVEGLGNESNIFRDKEGLIIRCYYFNSLLISLMRDAYPDILKYPVNRTIIDVTDEKISTLLIYSDSDRYVKSFCYELIIPPSTLKEFREYLKYDFTRYFKIHAKAEQKKMTCLIVTIPQKVHSKGGVEGIDIAPLNKSKFLRNQPSSVLSSILNVHQAFSTIPVIIEGDQNEKIDLDLPFDYYKLSYLQLTSFLRKSGFGLQEEEREIEVAVITDK